MSDKPIVIVDPRFRKMDEIFSDVFPEEPLDPNHPIRQAEGANLSARRAGSEREGLWEIGRMAVDDLEAIVMGCRRDDCKTPSPSWLCAMSLVAFRRTKKTRISTQDCQGNSQMKKVIQVGISGMGDTWLRTVLATPNVEFASLAVVFDTIRSFETGHAVRSHALSG